MCNKNHQHSQNPFLPWLVALGGKWNKFRSCHDCSIATQLLLTGYHTNRHPFSWIWTSESAPHSAQRSVPPDYWPSIDKRAWIQTRLVLLMANWGCFAQVIIGEDTHTFCNGFVCLLEWGCSGDLISHCSWSWKRKLAITQQKRCEGARVVYDYRLIIKKSCCIWSIHNTQSEFTAVTCF